jgi:hypothetical protein
MDKKIEQWGREFCRNYGIDWNYVDREVIIDEYYECHPKEVRPDEKTA